MGQDLVNTKPAMIPFSKDLHPITITQCKANTTFSKILVKGMENVNHSSNDQTIAGWRNRPKERQCILAKKIGDLMAIACGRTTRPEELWFDVRGDEDNHQIVPYKSRSTKDRKPKVEKYDKRPHKAAKALIGLFRKRVSFSLRKWKAIESNKGSSLDANEAETKTGCETAGLELCKKRILMGEKCRPLNVSGVLHYDKHGILLPEDVFST